MPKPKKPATPPPHEFPATLAITVYEFDDTGAPMFDILGPRWQDSFDGQTVAVYKLARVGRTEVKTTRKLRPLTSRRSRRKKGSAQ